MRHEARLVDVAAQIRRLGRLVAQLLLQLPDSRVLRLASSRGGFPCCRRLLRQLSKVD